MARVPVYGEPQVRERALEGGFQRAVDTGAGLAVASRALGQAADAIDRIDLQRAQTAADQVDATISTEWLKWDAENRNKFRGQNVDGYEPAAREWWQKARETYGKDLDPRARALASRSLVRKEAAAFANVAQFTAAERERFADESAAAAITSTIQFGVTTGDVAGAANQVREEVARMGARKGWTTEQVQAEQLRNLSQLHLAQITKLASLDADAARKYYEANKGEVAAQNQPRIEEILTGEADNQFATQFAATNADKPYAEQIKLAGEIEDPRRREKALIAVKNQQAQIREAQRAAEEAASDQAWQLASSGRRVPEAILAQMDGKERASLADWQRARAERVAKGGKVETDWDLYLQLREQLAAGDPVNLRAYTERIAPAQLEQLVDIQTKARSPGKQPEVATSEQQLSAYTSRLKLKGERLGQFKSAAYDAFNEHLRRTGKEPTFDERQKILDALTIEVVTHKGWLWDTTRPAYQATREQRQPVLDAALPPPGPVALPRVTTIEQWRRLEKGTRYIAPDGKERIKQ